MPMGGLEANGVAPTINDHKEPKPEPVDGAANAVHEHNPADPEAFYSPDHLKEREERQARRDVLKGYRKPIEQLPLNACWEIPGR